ncbi:MAG: hypothetical protein II732_05000, partial [Lachnospiraceae bacterium]|nr:hypothetical protein [Lachnospiraceae bacterium]
DKNCLVNSAAQKGKAWYTGKVAMDKTAAAHDGKNVKKTSLKDLESQSGKKSASGSGRKRTSQKNMSKNGPGHTM